MSDDISFSDVSTGERTKCGARVDDGVYTAFRQWVEEQTGKQYMEVGRALDRAMLEYMTDDQLKEIQEQTELNEALLRKVIDRLDSEKEKEITTATGPEPPKGKDPGSRRTREALVIRGLLANGYEAVKLGVLKKAIRETAGVSSDRTVRNYVEAITQTAAFQSHRRGNTWTFDKDGAREVLEQRGVPVPEEVER